MKHITYAEKSLLVGSETADTVMEYAAALARRGTADTVDVRAFGADGDEVVATLLLDAGAPIMAETVTTSMSEPDNTAAIECMRERLAGLDSAPQAGALHDSEIFHHDDYEIG